MGPVQPIYFPFDSGCLRRKASAYFNSPAAGDVFAVNFLMDRDAAGRARDLAALKEKVGECDTGVAVNPTGALSGSFTWRCATGRVSGSVLLAPTVPARIQEIDLRVMGG